MAAKFSVFKDRAKKYRFCLKASNGEIIAASESYPDKKSALKGIAAVVKGASVAKIVDETGEEEVLKRKPGRPPAAAAKTTAKAVAKTVAKARTSVKTAKATQKKKG